MFPPQGSTGAPAPPNLVSLVEPVPGSPLSAVQTDKHVIESPDGTRAEIVVTRRIMRDSAGRTRTETLAAGPPVATPLDVTILDYSSRTIVTLLPAAKVALRLKAPQSVAGFGIAVSGFPGELRPGTPDSYTLELGTREMDGIEFRGSRVEKTNHTPGSVKSYTERWNSRSHGLALSLVVVSGSESHSLALSDIRRGEPDPAFFEVPPGYAIRELQAAVRP